MIASDGKLRLLFFCAGSSTSALALQAGQKHAGILASNETYADVKSWCGLAGAKPVNLETSKKQLFFRGYLQMIGECSD